MCKEFDRPPVGVYDPMGMAFWRLVATVWILTGSLALSAPTLASAAVPTNDGELRNRLRGIENAFRAGDAAGLRLSCSAAGKIRVDLRGAPRQGSYGPGQVEVIFRQIFQEFRTTDFAFLGNDVHQPISDTAFARGRWVRRPRAGGAEDRETLTFTLQREGPAWRVQEIRSSRP
jgi:hypothetical protein